MDILSLTKAMDEIDKVKIWQLAIKTLHFHIYMAHLWTMQLKIYGSLE